MATKTIPARTEIICDCCQAITHTATGKGYRKQDGRLIVKQHGLDMHGDPACDGSVEFDLCDECLNGIVKAINNYTSNQRANDEADLRDPDRS